MTEAPAPKVRFLRALGRALMDDATYDLGRNPSLWLGFLVGLPTPFFALATDAPAWVKVLACLTPFAWSVLLGAAGRVGILAQRKAAVAQEEAELAHVEATEIQEHLDVTEEALGEEVLRREALQEEQAVVLSELRLAEAVQRTLMPDDISRDDVEVATKTAPSRFLGGDYVHTHVVENRWLYLVVADVSGHGLSAGLVVARMHGLVRRLTLTKQTPESMLERMNRSALAICRHTYFFITCVVGRLDLHTGVFEYATAGHPAQFLLRASGEIELLRTRNRLLGMDADIFDESGPTREVELAPGDSIVLFTDGLFELTDERGELLGEAGLRQRVAEIGPLAPALLLGEVLQDLAEYQGRTDFDDDVSLLVARYGGPAA